MRIVIDTNVVVSGLLVPGGPPARVLQQFRDGLWDLVISGEILEEYGEVLSRPKFGFSKEKVHHILQEVERRAFSVIPSKRYRAVPSDPDDNEFIDVAVEGNADYLISGDDHLLKLKIFHTIPILSPTHFLGLK